MAEVLRFFDQYQAALYFILGLGGIVYLYRFWLAWQEVSFAIYDLERQASRGRLNSAATVLFILLLFAVGIFMMTTLVRSLPIQELLATPTLDLSFASDVSTPTGSAATLVTATPLPTVSINPSACVADRIEISAPEAGDVLQGAVEVRGTVDVPSFGYYKLERSRAEEELFLTIQAGRTIVRDGVLVERWDTTSLPPGDYVLQLVVTDSAGEELPPCRIPVRIEAVEQ
ncbi:MAG: hypothetical protein WEA61_04700 [Anaerolineales bacterium]